MEEQKSLLPMLRVVLVHKRVECLQVLTTVISGW